MKISIKRIQPESLALSVGMVALALSLPDAIKPLLTSESARLDTSKIITLITAPLLGGAIGAMHGLAIAWIYNLYARYFNGVTLEISTPPPDA